MAQTVLWGSGASVTFPTGQGFLASSARISINQTVMTAGGFGQAWKIKRGAAKDYSVNIAGVLTSGSTTDQVSSTGMAQAGISVAVTFNTLCSFTDTMIQSNNSLGAAYESVDDASYSFEGPTDFTGPVIAWTAS